MPERIEDYEVLGIIGTGSFGTCYKVRKKNTSHVFVWKAVDYGCMSEDRKMLLVTEVNLLRELKHPNIVRYYDRILHKESTTIYIIMEWCEGGDLATLINKCRRNNTYLDELFVWRVLYQSSRALQACHGPGRPVLHRDIKPANLFLDSEFNIKLGDFGLARVLNAKSIGEDMDAFCAQTIVGTPFYMSPEVVRGNKYNRKSDIWSLGCVTYELCSLFPPFACNNVNALAQRIKDGRFSRIPSHYSDELHQIIVFMLTVDHEVRPSIETILHHPSVVSHIAQWSLAKPLYRKKNVVTETSLLVNKSEVLLNETFCSCTDDCCANETSLINTQIGIPCTLKQTNASQKESKPSHMHRIASMQTGKIKCTLESDALAEPARQKEVDSGVEKETTCSIAERINLLRQREAKLRMRELTLEERERSVRRKEREAALASRLARETMGRACVYLKNCRDGRGSASSTITKTTLQSRSLSIPSLPDADSSLDQEHGDTSTIATTSARLDPRSISKPFWHERATGTRKVTFSLKNSHLPDELYVDPSTVDNIKNGKLLTEVNYKGAKNLRPGSWSDGQAWLEGKRQVYRENMDILGKENTVPTGQKVNKISTKKTSLPQLHNLEKPVRTLR